MFFHPDALFTVPHIYLYRILFHGRRNFLNISRVKFSLVMEWTGCFPLNVISFLSIADGFTFNFLSRFWRLKGIPSYIPIIYVYQFDYQQVVRFLGKVSNSV